MAKASPAADKYINRRIVLKASAAFAAAGPVLLRGGHAEAQPRALFAYVGAFTTPERKGHGGGINVYRVDPTSGAWTHEQLLEIVNPSFLTLDRAQRFLYSVHADLKRSVRTRSTSKTGTSRRSIGSPVASRTQCTCRSIRLTAGLSLPIIAPARSAWCRSRRTELWGHAAIWSACPANQARIANSRPARIPTRPFLIRAAGSSPCPTRDLTGSSSFASTRRAGNSCRTTHPSSPRERAPAQGTLRFIRKCHSRM